MAMNAMPKISVPWQEHFPSDHAVTYAYDVRVKNPEPEASLLARGSRGVDPPDMSAYRFA
jgi:hypothetical protein